MPSRPVLRTGLSCVVAGGLAFAANVVGCSRDTDLSGVLADAGAHDTAPAGPRITVTTRAAQLTAVPGDKASATWAAYRLDDGAWTPTAPVAVGTYLIPVPTAVWSIALVCSSDDDAFTKVFVHRRSAATLAFDAALEQECTPDAPAPEFAFSGMLTGLPASTQWLDFGYPRDSRGSAIAAAGGSATYEVVGIEPGAWDLAFGLRDDSFGALTRIVLRRGVVVSADEKLDVDFAGGGAFAPGTKGLVLRGIDPADTITPSILYAAAGGPSGIEVGPQDLPADQADVTMTYATVPDGARSPGDRYHGVITAQRDRRSALRSIELTIAQASDLDLTLPEPLVEPRATIVASGSAIRLATRFPALAGAVRHEVLAVAVINRRTQHAWQSTVDGAVIAGAPEVEETMPDLSALPGWRPAWELPPGIDLTVTAMAVDAEQAIGDGTMQRTTAKATTVTP